MDFFDCCSCNDMLFFAFSPSEFALSGQFFEHLSPHPNPSTQHFPTSTSVTVFTGNPVNLRTDLDISRSPKSHYLQVSNSVHWLTRNSFLLVQFCDCITTEALECPTIPVTYLFNTVFTSAYIPTILQPTRYPTALPSILRPLPVCAPPPVSHAPMAQGMSSLPTPLPPHMSDTSSSIFNTTSHSIITSNSPTI